MSRTDPAARREYKREWTRRNREKVRGYHRRHVWKTKFGLTPAEYAELHAAQGGLCAICSRPERRITRRKGWESLEPRLLAVDHNPTTGAVRALLCADCNSALGLFQDREEVLLRAAEYLRNHSTVSEAV